MKRWRHRLHARMVGSGRDDGFSLAEVLVAISVFAGVSAAILGITVQSLQTTFQNRQRVVAANLAAQEMDLVRSTQVADLPIGLSDTFYDADLNLLPAADDMGDADVAYQVQRLSEWIAAGTNESPCTATTMVGSTSVAYLSVQVQITWPRMNAVTPVRSDTLVTPTVGTFDRNSGNVPVRVFDADGAPRAREYVDLLAVSSTGVESFYERIRTDTSGCAFFSFVPVGNYVVLLDRDGYSDKQSKEPSRTPVTITAGQTAGAVALEFDESAALLAALPRDTTYKLPCGLPVVLANASLLDVPARAGERVVPGGTCIVEQPPATPSATPLRFPGLFPYPSGVEAWLGDCRDSDPADPAWGPLRGTRPNAALEPGQDSDVMALKGRQVELLLTETNNRTRVRANQRIVLFHAVETGVGARCTTSRSYELGRTGLDGKVTVTLPYGTYNLRVGGNNTNRNVFDTTANTGGATTSFVVSPETSILRKNVRS